MVQNQCKDAQEFHSLTKYTQKFIIYLYNQLTYVKITENLMLHKWCEQQIPYTT